MHICSWHTVIRTNHSLSFYKNITCDFFFFAQIVYCPLPVKVTCSYMHVMVVKEPLRDVFITAVEQCHDDHGFCTIQFNIKTMNLYNSSASVYTFLFTKYIVAVSADLIKSKFFSLPSIHPSLICVTLYNFRTYCMDFFFQMSVVDCPSWAIFSDIFFSIFEKNFHEFFINIWDPTTAKISKCYYSNCS